MFYRQLYSFHRLLDDLKALLSTPTRKLVIDDIVHIDGLTSNLDWGTGHPTKVSVRRDSEAEILGKQVLALIVAEFDSLFDEPNSAIPESFSSTVHGLPEFIDDLNEFNRNMMSIVHHQWT